MDKNFIKNPDCPDCGNKGELVNHYLIMDENPQYVFVYHCNYCHKDYDEFYSLIFDGIEMEHD